MINPPRTTDKMIKSLGIEKWRAENEEVCEELGISAKIVYKQISLETAEALVNDSLELRRIYEEMGGK